MYTVSFYVTDLYALFELTQNHYLTWYVTVDFTHNRKFANNLIRIELNNLINQTESSISRPKDTRQLSGGFDETSWFWALPRCYTPSEHLEGHQLPPPHLFRSPIDYWGVFASLSVTKFFWW